MQGIKGKADSGGGIMPYICRRCNNGQEFECGYSERVRLNAIETGTAFIDAYGETEDSDMMEREITDTEDSWDWELSGEVECSRCHERAEMVEEAEYNRLFPAGRVIMQNILNESKKEAIQLIKEKLMKGGTQNGGI